jgi:hypothetical protein
MNKMYLVAVMVFAIGMGYVIGTMTTGCSTAAKQYEYLVENSADLVASEGDMTKAFNNKSAQGWEYCGSHGSGVIFRK